MIRVVVSDALTPLLTELKGRTQGLAQEALQIAGSKVAAAARSELEKMGTHWFNDVINGEYTIWRDPAKTKQLGARISHSEGGAMSPSNVSSLIQFYLAPHSLTVTVGGAHPAFRPIVFKDGLPSGYMGKVGSVGKIGRSIIHKLNTGDVTSEHPYYGGETPIEGAQYVKDRFFMERGFAIATKGVYDAFGGRFEESFNMTVDNIDVTPIRRNII